MIYRLEVPDNFVNKHDITVTLGWQDSSILYFHPKNVNMGMMANIVKDRILTLYAGKFACFLSSVDFFSKSTFPKHSIRDTIRVPNILDPDQA